jgi:hypothetical protein
VATYARAEAVDIRIWTHADDADGLDAGQAAALVAGVEAQVIAELGEHVWARGQRTWPELLEELLVERGWRLSAVEVGLRGALLGLLGEGLAERLAFGEALPDRPSHDGERMMLERLAERVREIGGSEVGVAVEARERGGDTAVTVAVVTPEASHRETRVVFLGGAMGRSRAAVAAASILASRLRDAAVAVS